jgi:hypothetical protein
MTEMTELTELNAYEEVALLKDRNRKAREAINKLVAENAELRAEVERLRSA